MLIYIQSVIAVILGIIASITDFKDKKIYNKNVLVAFCISLLSYMIFWKFIKLEYLCGYIINLIITLIVSFCFFYFKIWAAGDAKLFLAIIFMIPFEVYESKALNVFPALNLLIIIFSVAFIYVIFETIYLLIKDEKKNEKFKISKFTKQEIVENTVSYFMGYFLISFINKIIFNQFEEFGNSNLGLITICNMLILMFIYQIITNQKQKLFITGILFFANVICSCIYGFSISSINFSLLLIVLAIMLFRRISEEYNYQEIDIKELKDRMILSYGSVLKFYGSKVKGLPNSTTESTDSRLTKEQVESIKRWSKTKKGTDRIVVVRHMPFAPFMLCGEIIFFILRIYS